MSGTGIVDDVSGGALPDTNASARKVIVNRADQPQVAFFIPPDGPAPERGEAVSWGPHHVWWLGERVAKLSWEMAP